MKHSVQTPLEKPLQPQWSQRSKNLQRTFGSGSTAPLSGGLKKCSCQLLTFAKQSISLFNGLCCWPEYLHTRKIHVSITTTQMANRVRKSMMWFWEIRRNEMFKDPNSEKERHKQQKCTLVSLLNIYELYFRLQFTQKYIKTRS